MIEALRKAIGIDWDEADLKNVLRSSTAPASQAALHFTQEAQREGGNNNCEQALARMCISNNAQLAQNYWW